MRKLPFHQCPVALSPVLDLLVPKSQVDLDGPSGGNPPRNYGTPTASSSRFILGMGKKGNRILCRHYKAEKKKDVQWHTVDPLDPLPAEKGREGSRDHCPTHQRDWLRRKAAAAEALVSSAASGRAHRPPLAPLPVSEPLFAPSVPSSARPLAAVHVPEALSPPPPRPSGSAAAGE